LNETKHLIDDYEDQEHFYLLTNFNIVTIHGDHGYKHGGSVGLVRASENLGESFKF